MGWESNTSKTETNFMEFSKMGSQRGKVSTSGSLETYMREVSLEAGRKDLATGGLEMSFTSGNGESENLMDMVS